MLDKGHEFAGIVGAFTLWCSLVERLEAKLISARSVAIAKRGLSTSVTILFSRHRWWRKRTSRRGWSHWQGMTECRTTTCRASCATQATINFRRSSAVNGIDDLFSRRDDRRTNITTTDWDIPGSWRLRHVLIITSWRIVTTK